jgi:hypothetical protein
MNQEIKNIIELEKSHRKIFDIFYVQDFNIKELDKEEIEKYKLQCDKYPDFRTQCAEFLISLHNNRNKDQESLYQELLQINYSRYSIDNTLLERINKIKKNEL